MNYKARKDKLHVEEIAGELVIYDQERRLTHHLNASAATVWRHCDGNHTEQDLILLFLDQGSEVVAKEVVDNALAQLSRAHLLVDDPETEVAPVLSRRQMLRQFALVGSAAILVPLVTSMLTASPAYADGQCPDTVVSKLSGQYACTPGSADGNAFITYRVNDCHGTCTKTEKNGTSAQIPCKRIAQTHEGLFQDKYVDHNKCPEYVYQSYFVNVRTTCSCTR
jgi:hypothetical protein